MMKKTLYTLVLIFSISMMGYGQHGFILEFVSGSFDEIDLSTATQTPIGAGLNGVGAGDIGPNGIYYAIKSFDEEIYEVDTTDGSYTLIGSIVPPANHTWTGMAYDESDGIMYGLSSQGTTSGTCSLHTIDLSTGTPTLVGSQSTASAISCIAIDDQGQMYGINASSNGELYAIDKTDGSVSLIGPVGVGVAGMGQGLDYCMSNQTMYFTNYNSITFVNSLRTVNLTTGATTEIGPIQEWTGSIAIPGSLPLVADFTADVTSICIGGSVNFTDLSSGAIISWEWNFEGGTPASSTDQNPQVVYNSTGTYDVELIIGNGSDYDTLLMEDYIFVTQTPGQATTPTGPAETCAGLGSNYTTNTVQYASSYEWEVSPSNAGTMNGSDTISTFQASSSYSGSYTIKVRAVSMCGDGAWSGDFTGNVVEAPEAFQIEGDGGYCEGGQGSEITMENSETGVDYELYLDDVATGNIVSGTGNPISWGFVTDEGLYSAQGTNGSCNVDMYGEVYVFIESLPGQAGTPEGPGNLCNDTTTNYTTSGASDADTLVWIMDPETAGELIPNNDEVSVEWAAGFSGVALLSVYGENDCGSGDPSEAIEIEVYATPDPVINGDAMTCQYYQGIVYSTEEIANNSYVWEVEGGTISSGAGTHQITVDWGAAGTGWVRVTEESPEGCFTTTVDFVVTIDECVGVEEQESVQLHLYPNPVNEQLNLQLAGNIEEDLVINILDISGRVIAQYPDNANEKNFSIRVDDLDHGFYMLVLKGKNTGILTKGFIKK